MKPVATGREILFQPRGIPPLGASVSLALQHLVAMIVGCVTPPIIIAGAVGLSPADQVLLIQASLVMSAVSTLLQLFPIGKYFGSGLPVILGVSFAYVPSMQAIAASGGGIGRTLNPDDTSAGPSSYGQTDLMSRMYADATFAGSSSVPAHVEMMGFIGMGNNPMVGATVAMAVRLASLRKGK